MKQVVISYHFMDHTIMVYQIASCIVFAQYDECILQQIARNHKGAQYKPI